MSALEQVLKWAGNLPLERLMQFLPLDRIPLDKIAGNAVGAIGEFKNRERMSSVDTAWLRMDTPVNLMMIVGVMMFDGPMDMARLKRTLTHRLLRYKRFRQRVVQDPSGAYWVDDENFDIDNHVHAVNLPEPGGKPALQGLAAALATQSLDQNKPLWTITVVERYDDHGVLGSAVVIRIHHCIADGIALIGVMYSLTDEAADAAEEGIESEGLRRAREKRAAHGAREDRDLLASVFDPISDAASKALSMSGDFWSKYQDVLSNPEKVADAARVAADVTTEVAALALLPADSDTSLKGKPSAVKRVAWSEPMPLAEIKSVCKVLGVSVNDILLSCCAGAIGEYLRSNGEATEGVEIRGMVPVNLRPRGQEHKLGNHFGLVVLTLPVGIENPFVRLYAVKRRMDELKNSYQAIISMGILGAVGFLPRPMQKQVLDLFSSKATAVMTNVPGPQIPLYMAGNRLAQQMFWVPQSGDIGVGVSILSYNNQVQFGLVTDKKFVPEPARIVDRFTPEFEKLVFYLLLNGSAPQAHVPQATEVVIASPARKRTVSTEGRTSRPRAVKARATAGERAKAPVVAPPGIRKGGMLKRLREQQ
jgi:diacylglycerol O-acyltransferase / wax synthase